MPAQIFKGKTFAAAGPLPGQFTIENMKRWASLRKGVFLDDFDEGVTHLLCTKEQFDKKVLRIREALKRKRVNIIHVDWFEFSTVKNAKLDESDYSMRNIQAKDNAKKRERARREKGRRNGEKFVNTSMGFLTILQLMDVDVGTDFFHLYRDRENFVYEVDITRDDNQTGELGQKYTLYLWESNAIPHLYRFTAKFLKRKGSSQPSYFRPSPCEGKWRAEMDLFMDFFKKKTGIEWQDRITFAYTGLTSMFQYTPPTEGRPVGRRLRHDLDYCREINAHIRGLPWPPVKDSEVESVSTEDDSDSGPRAFDDDDDDMIDSSPGAEDIPEKHESVATIMQVHGVETHKHQPKRGLETPPRDEKGEPRIVPTSPIPPNSDDTTPVKIATPAPSSDGNDVLESSEGVSAISSEEIGIEVSLKPGPQEREAALTSAVESAPDNVSSSELATLAPSSDEKEVVDVSANYSRVLDEETGMWISLDFEPRERL
ncbi:hypothetical protein FGRMN_10618 [Fusarium graminum]|nr:hypothetical protein FGRMN_10618 [Fusarium graminum]